MAVQELLQIVKGELITVGGHTHNCLKLSSMPRSDQFDEIARNKDILEEVLGCTLEYFSYPFGTDNINTAEITDILRHLRYSLAFGNSYGATGIIAGQTNRYDLPRFKVGNWNRFTFYKFLRRFFY